MILFLWNQDYYSIFVNMGDVRCTHIRNVGIIFRHHQSLQGTLNRGIEPLIDVVHSTSTFVMTSFKISGIGDYWESLHRWSSIDTIKEIKLSWQGWDMKFMHVTNTLVNLSSLSIVYHFVNPRCNSLAYLCFIVSNSSSSSRIYIYI